MSVEEALVNATLDAKYETLPSEIVEITKHQILDGLGVMLAGTQATGISELVDLVKEWGGAQQATIIGYGIKVPAPNAAQVNSTMIHALDFDDSSDTAALHPGATVLATCLAMAEYKPPLNGKELINCMAWGTNLIHRLGRATWPKGELVNIGWHTSSIYGVLGSAAIAGKILGLDFNQMLNAFGIAYHQSAGNLQCVYDGALTKRMGPGFSTRNGIISAMLAKKGITGAANWLTGRAGLINVYHNGDFDTDILLADLSKRFDGVDLTFKPYPCCRLTHAFIDAALELANGYSITADKVKEITVFAGEGAYYLCIPPEDRCNPKNTVASQFSVPWAIATSIVRRKASISDFSQEAIKDPLTLSVANKITPQLDNGLVGHGIQPGRVRIKTVDGNEYTRQVDCPLGNPQKPMSPKQFEDKFYDCASHSIKPFSKKKITTLISLVKDLEKVDDVRSIINVI